MKAFLTFIRTYEKDIHMLGIKNPNNIETLKEINYIIPFNDKLKFVIFNSVYSSNVQHGGGILDKTEQNLDEVIVINTDIVDKLEIIATLCQQITQKLLLETYHPKVMEDITKGNIDIGQHKFGTTDWF